MPITLSGDSPNFTTVAATTVNGVTTLNSSSGVLATQNGMTGIAKAWVNFDGTGTPAIRGSFNVSSIFDNGTGDYTVNFTTAMPNANYSAVYGSGEGTASSGLRIAASSGNTTTTTRVAIRNLGNSLQDAEVVCVAVFSS
tara:strand:- start:507 stop:926 length:420 start_codon:yes stop_codon:yes gene_type:complete